MGASAVVGSTAATVLAGGVGSAIGLCVAYPIDVLKTKAQVKVCIEGKANETLFARANNILRQEGIAGFYGGVITAMIGKAFTSSISFGANRLAIGVLNASNFLGGVGGLRADTPFVTLLLAACFAGFIQTFLNCPIERVKVMMQAQENGSLYANELECIKSIIHNEGWRGLLTRGFGPTLAREVPSNAIYFVVYGLLMQTAMKDTLGIMASMVCGAISGMACWIPVYPIDVVKTRMQNTKGGESASGKPVSAMGVAVVMYKTEGIGAFFDGLGLLLFRAALDFLQHTSTTTLAIDLFEMGEDGVSSTSLLTVIGSTVASVLAGGVGSAIGLCVAYPIDVLKTKAQVKVCIEGKANETVFARARTIFQREGIAGFFGGVTSAMIGSALISAVSFSTNKLVIGLLNASNFLGGGVGGGAVTPFVTLLIAAFFSGFVQTFVVVPVDRIKVMMQAQENGSLYANELECFNAILRSEGWLGLLTRGFGITLAREVPSNAIYFVVYGLLMQTAMKDTLGIMASMVCGAISGMACWIPVYPIDVVKTRMQNTKGGESASGKPVSGAGVAVVMYKTEGIGAFFDGLGLLLFRAAVSNGVTFWVYDLIMGSLGYA